jgi:serine/threonine-protein kinase RsbW
MQLSLLLHLPHDAAVVPVARRLLTGTLNALGAERECVRDIAVALSEACTNVLRHADAHDDFEVTAAIDDSLCVLEVVDRGSGFDATLVPGEVAADSEAGRGLRLMRSLLDAIDFENHPRGGTVAHLYKRLVWDPSALARRVASREA